MCARARACVRERAHRTLCGSPATTTFAVSSSSFPANHKERQKRRTCSGITLPETLSLQPLTSGPTTTTFGNWPNRQPRQMKKNKKQTVSSFAQLLTVPHCNSPESGGGGGGVGGGEGGRGEGGGGGSRLQ